MSNNFYIISGIVGTAVGLYAGKYIIDKHGLKIANRGLDCYLSIKNSLNPPKDEIMTQEKNPLITLLEIQIRPKLIKPIRFRINKIIGASGDYTFTFKSLGLNLDLFQPCYLDEVNLVNRNSLDRVSLDDIKLEICHDNDSESMNRSITSEVVEEAHYQVDVFYQYQDKNYIITIVSGQSEVQDSVFNLNPGAINVTPIVFESVQIYDQDGFQINVEGLLQRINEYLGPRGDFNHSKLRLKDLYLPEGERVNRIVLQTMLGETLEISNNHVIDINDLF